MTEDQSAHLKTLIACEQCDQLQHRQPVPDHAIACCQHCGSKLYSHDEDNLTTSLALTLTALILFIIANTFPMLTMNLSGHSQQANLMSASAALYEHGSQALAVLVFLTSILAPLLELIGLLYVLTALQRKSDRPFKHLSKVFKAINYLTPWRMVEVFMLGILVSLVKLADLATIIVDSGLYAFAALILVLSALTSSLNKPKIWQKLEQHR